MSRPPPTSRLLAKQAVKVEEFSTFCEAARKILTAGDRSRECVDVLRELLAQLLVNPRDHRLPRGLAVLILAIAGEPEQGPPRLRLLCAAVLAACAPSAGARIRSFAAPVDRAQIPLLLPVLLADERSAMTPHTATLKQWVLGVQADTGIQAMSVCVVAGTARYHRGLLAPAHARSLNNTLVEALCGAAVVSASPLKGGTGLWAPVGRSGDPLREFDGGVSRDMFTVLSVAKHYSPDQLLSVHIFSMLGGWLEDTFRAAAELAGTEAEAEVRAKAHARESHAREDEEDKGEERGHETQGQGETTHAIASSKVAAEGSSSAFLSLSKSVEAAARDARAAATAAASASPELSTIFRTDATEYCLRVLEQALGAAGAGVTGQDALLLQTAAVQAVRVLGLVCRADSEAIPRVLPALKRLVARGASGRPYLQLELMRFFLAHGDVVVFDREPLYSAFFGDSLARGYANQALVADTLDFCLAYAPRLSASGAFRVYFPTLLKAIAWSPRTFAHEAMELLPALLTPNTLLEMAHALLDLPTLAAALEQQAAGGAVKQAAARTPMAAALYNYILRNEGGLGGTIDRLSELHELTATAASSLRVRTASELAPLLLQSLFDTVCAEGSFSQAAQLALASLERAGTLYPLEAFRTEMRGVLARGLVALFRRHPSLVVDLADELLEHISTRRNVAEGREEFFVHVVWLVGAYASGPECPTAVLLRYHEVLELFAYEVNMVLQAADREVVNQAYAAVHTTRLMTVLMLALAKLATRCQDLLPRVLLCLTKVARQHSGSTRLDASARGAVLERATQLINALKNPPISAAVFGASAEAKATPTGMNALSVAAMVDTIAPVVSASES